MISAQPQKYGKNYLFEISMQKFQQNNHYYGPQVKCQPRFIAGSYLKGGNFRVSEDSSMN